MEKATGTKITFVLSLLFTATFAFAQTSSSSSSSSTVTNTTNNAPANEVNSNTNSKTQTTITNSTTTTTVDDGDARIVGMIYKKYANNSAMIGTSLTVTSTNGVVQISGDVTTTSQAQEAVNVAKSIEGVKEVRSSINVITNQTKDNQPATPNY